jgi:hypothetical protein
MWASPVSDTSSGHVRVSNLAGSVDSDTVQLIILGPVSLHLDSYSQSTGAATVTVTGTPGVTYALQWSTDFVSWSAVVTGPSPFTATDVSNGEFRMYRAVSQ